MHESIIHSKINNVHLEFLFHSNLKLMHVIFLFTEIPESTFLDLLFAVYAL